jgi:DNA recombination protein RmuC
LQRCRVRCENKEVRSVIQAFGLQHGIDYHLQYHIIGDEQEKLRPDAVIFLPRNHAMIIDAKASKFLLEDNSEALEKSMLTHLKELGNKNYNKILKEHCNKNSFSC